MRMKGSSDMAYKAFDLTGKTAIVTGGNSGIGLGMAEAMAHAGAAVCIWGTNEDKNVHALARLHAIGAKALALRCDVSDEAAVEHAFAETVSALGGVDACFVNAGVSGRGAAASFAEMTTQEWHRVLAVNLDGAFFTLRAAARHMTARGSGGSLAVTASLAALEGSPLSAHYAASKGAMLSVMRALSVGLARHKIRVNAIVPGWIETPMTEKAVHGEAFKTRVLASSTRRPGSGRAIRRSATARRYLRRGSRSGSARGATGRCGA